MSLPLALTGPTKLFVAPLSETLFVPALTVVVPWTAIVLPLVCVMSPPVLVADSEPLALTLPSVRPPLPSTSVTS